MKADKGQFDEVLRRLVSAPPKKTSEIKAEKKEKEKAAKPSQKSARRTSAAEIPPTDA
jgi:hypothetical protein